MTRTLSSVQSGLGHVVSRGGNKRAAAADASAAVPCGSAVLPIWSRVSEKRQRSGSGREGTAPNMATPGEAVVAAEVYPVRSGGAVVKCQLQGEGCSAVVAGRQAAGSKASCKLQSRARTACESPRSQAAMPPRLQDCQKSKECEETQECNERWGLVCGF